MIRGGKANQGRSKGLIQELNKDRINQLPDHLISEILSHLPTMDAVKTSVLSTRWRSLWLCVPRLKLDSQEFPDFNDFLSFGVRFFDSSRVSCIHKMELTYARVDDDSSYLNSWVDDDTSYLKSWIDAAVKRKIQHLDVKCPAYEDSPGTDFLRMPLSLCICETLVSLTLHLVALPVAEFVSLPCLKTLHLEAVDYPNETTFEGLVSCCPVLEELEIFATEWITSKIYRVLSRTLKKFSMEISSSDSEVVIDAPRLCFLSINADISESVTITNMDSNASLDISLGFGFSGIFDEAMYSSTSNSSIRSFLPGISRVMDMKIFEDTFRLLCEYSRLEPLPQFGYMSRLHVSLCYSHSKWLPTFLESCPNLKSLSLECYGKYKELYLEGMNQISFSSVPECLLSSLESVEFKVRLSRRAPEMKLVRYFLENSAILKKLILYVNYDPTDCGIFKELLRIPRGSAECEVVVL